MSCLVVKLLRKSGVREIEGELSSGFARHRQVSSLNSYSFDLIATPVDSQVHQ